MYEVEVKTMPETPLIYVPHQGAYVEIGGAFERLFGALSAQSLISGPPRTIAVFYDDPDRVPVDALRSRAGMAATGTETIAPPLEMMTLAGGPMAVLRYKGAYTGLKAAYDWLYGQWLPQSGRQPADGPCFEEYLNSPMDTAPADLLTDIYVPLKG